MTDDQAPASRFVDNGETAWSEELAYIFSSSQSPATYNSHVPTTVEALHPPQPSFGIDNNNIRYGSSVNNTGELFGFQSPSTTTFSPQASQFEGNLGSFDFNNDFLLFDDPAEFVSNSSMGLSGLSRDDITL